MLGVYLDLQDQAENIAALQNIVKEYQGLFEGTYADVDQTLKKLNDALYSAGLKEVLEEANLQLRAAGR
jgi:hypothetical protein